MSDEVLILVDDLFFSSKIVSTARLCGVSARLLKTRRELLQNTDPERTKLIIVDLNGRTTQRCRPFRNSTIRPDGTTFPFWPSIPTFRPSLPRKPAKPAPAGSCPRSAFSTRLARILTDFEP